MKRILSLILAVLVVCTVCSVTAFADGSTSISLSRQSANIGDQITVTVKFSASEVFYGAEATVAYNSSVLQFVEGDDTSCLTPGTLIIATDSSKTSKSISIVFKATSIGSSDITVLNPKYSSGGEKQSMSGSGVRVSVSNPTSQLPGNADLKGLVISAGTLTPAFNKNVTTYNITVDNSVTKLLVTATPEDSKATWDVQGSANLKEGKNTRTVVVTAQNGTKKSYVLNITRAAANGTVPADQPTTEPETPEVNPYEVEIGGEKMYLLNDYSGITAPPGYTLSTLTINGTEMPVLKNVTGEILVYIKNADGSKGNFYLYNSSKSEFAVYKLFSTASTQYAALDLPSGFTVPEGFIKATEELFGYKVEGVKYGDTYGSEYKNLFIFYGVDANGNEGYFRFDKSDSSIQRAVEFAGILSGGNGGEAKQTIKFSQLDSNKKTIVIASAVLLLLIIAAIVVTIVRIVSDRKQKNISGTAPDDVFTGGDYNEDKFFVVTPDADDIEQLYDDEPNDLETFTDTEEDKEPQITDDISDSESKDE